MTAPDQRLAASLDEHIVDKAMEVVAELRITGTADDRLRCFRMARSTLTGAVVAFGERLPEDASVEPSVLRDIIDGTAKQLIHEYHLAAHRARQRRGDRLN